MTLLVELPIMATVGENLRRQRLRAKMSLTDLADASGIDKAHLSEYENNHRTPSVRTLCTLSGALNVKPAKLLEGICL